MDILLEHTGKGFIIMLTIAMPAVLTAAAIGLVVGILQAVTQVQEQTIAAAPKILGVFLVIIMMGGFSVTTLIEYFRTAANIAFHIIPKADETILPPSGYYTKQSQWFEEKHYGKKDRPTIKEIMKNPGKVPYSDKKLKESYTKPAEESMSNPNFIENKGIIQNQLKKEE